MSSESDLGWIAGFFDGEGHISYRRSIPNKNTGKVSPALQCSIPQGSGNIEVLEIFRSIVGFGTIRGPYKMPNGKPQHVLTYSTEEIPKLFSILKPNLKGEKTKDFQSALIGYWTHDPNATKEDIARALKRNKKKGCFNCGSEWNGIICAQCGHIE